MGYRSFRVIVLYIRSRDDVVLSLVFSNLAIADQSCHLNCSTVRVPSPHNGGPRDLFNAGPSSDFGLKIIVGTIILSNILLFSIEHIPLNYNHLFSPRPWPQTTLSHLYETHSRLIVTRRRIRLIVTR